MEFTAHERKGSRLRRIYNKLPTQPLSKAERKKKKVAGRCSDLNQHHYIGRDTKDSKTIKDLPNKDIAFSVSAFLKLRECSAKLRFPFP